MPLRAPPARPISRARPAAALAAILLLAAPLLSGCGGGTKAAGTGDLIFKPLAPDVYTVVIPANADVPKTEAALRKYCDGKPSCTIYGWTDATAVAPRVPLDDSHYASLAVRYVAHAVGTDDMMWDCLRFLKARAPCLPKA
jgi:hypothetical protein